MSKKIVATILAGLFLSACSTADNLGPTGNVSNPKVSVTKNEDGSIKVVKNVSSPNPVESEKQANVEEEKDINKNLDEDKRQKTAIVAAPQGISATKYATLERESDGFKINYPSSWYYNIVHDNSGQNSFVVLYGFAPDASIHNTNPPYPIELRILKSGADINIDGHHKKAGSNDKFDFIVNTSIAEYKAIVDVMSESFELISN